MRVRVYIKPFDLSGAYQANWLEITDDVVVDGVTAIRESLDGTDFDVGIFRSSALNLTVLNSTGKYSDIGSPYSIFQFKRTDSLVKITWDLASHPFQAGASQIGDILGLETTVYLGLLKDEDARMNLDDFKLQFSVLGRESIFDQVIAPNTLANGQTISQILLACLNQPDITEILTISAGNISPGYDAVIDDVSNFATSTVREILNDLLLISNSVLYISNDSVFISARTPGASVAYQFFGQASTAGRENVQDIANIRSGLSRLFNFVTWKDTALSSINVSTVTTYGYRKKEISAASVTTTATRQAILDAIRGEFGLPKQEFELTTPIGYDVLALSLLSRVTLDYPELVISRSDVAYYEHAVYEVSEYPKTLSGFSILTSQNFKIMARSTDLLKGLVTFTLREI